VTSFSRASLLEIKGASLSLRGLGADDVTARYIGWLNDPEVNALSSRFELESDAASCRHYLSTRAPEEVVLGMFLPDVGHVGNIKFGPVDRPNSRADISIMIGERSVWGKGLGREAVYLVTRHLFRHENLNRVDAGSGNPAFVRLVQSIGWKVEGVQRARVNIGGKMIDWVMVSQLRSEFIERPQFHHRAGQGIK